ncbi:MAG: NUDIX domain-containing protein [Porticoccaceae bacterium]|nr:NUDIX domain-containing protein [Porticoccaceae bacterium]MDG1473401.1 NUDIX domain-containing protein [Porticoccaceae bacterium]
MPIDKHKFNSDDVCVIASELAYQGFFQIRRVSLRHRLFGGGWSQPVQREIFQRGEAVGVLLYDPQNQLIGLVEQFRIGALSEPLGPWQFEVVAGMLEAGEMPADVAHREVQEEAGLSVDKLIPICDYLVSAGGTDEKMYMFCGLVDLKNKQGLFGLDSESEDIALHVWSYQEVLEARSAGLLNSAAVTIALQWLEISHKTL